MARKRRGLVVDPVLAEFQAYRAGNLSALCNTSRAPDGVVEYCGADDDPAHWAICHVRASNGAVVPLVVGEEQHVAAEFDMLDRRCAAGVWDPLLVPTPVALIDGREYPFKPARGRHLLGVVELDREAVLLAAADDRLVALLVVDGAATVVPLGRPRRVREVDVDLLRSWAGLRSAANSKPPDGPLRPSADTRAHHIRIVPGRRVELGEGLTLSQLLEAMFADIEVRATTPPKPPKPPRGKPAAPAPEAASADVALKRPKRPKLKGKTWVSYVLKYLRKMALEGSLDLVGLTGTIIAAIQARFPDFRITGEAFADALKLLVATGTCLMAPHEKGDRIWRINLEGLSDPTSAQHRRLCRETRGRVRVEEAAANQQSPRLDAPAASEGEPSSAVDADDAPGDATDQLNASPGESRETPPVPATTAPDADRAAALAEPASTESMGQADALELVRRRGMILIAGYIFLLACRLGAADAGAPADAPGDAAAKVDASPRIDETVPLDAIDDGASRVEAAPQVDEAVIRDATVAAEVEDGPPADEAVVPNTAGVNTPDTDQAVVGGAAEDACADEAVAPIASRDDAASDDTVDVDGAPPCAVVTPEHDEIAPNVDRPTLRYGARRAPLRDAFAPVQPEPQCRDLGTLGPRGPPASRRG